jgi:hypothetical protein
MHQCDTATWYNAFFNGCTGCVQGVIDPVFALFHFDLSRTSNFDHCNAARKLCEV